MNRLLLSLLVFVSPLACSAQTIAGMCMISASQQPGKPSVAELMLTESNCNKDTEGCVSMSNTNLEWTRWSGISQQTLQSDATKVSAHMLGDAGDLACDGTVHEGVLAGRFRFTANASFASTMAAMGFEGITPRKQLSFLMLDVTPAWAKSMQSLGVTELSTSKLTGLRALHVDADYIHAMAAAGYPELRAGKLTQMKAGGVTPDKVRDARAMGFQPNEAELIQMSIFKIDRPFVERMRARGLNDLTLAKLIKIKIFKLEE